MKDIYILAIESSCDETSCAIVKNGNTDVATVVLSQVDIHTNFGGVVPEIASRHHLKNITIIIEECLNRANMTFDEIDFIAVTYGPGLVGSLLVGLESAKTLSFVLDKPLIPVHHIAGHIYANNIGRDIEYPLVALVVSGGHTELIYMESAYKFEKIGGTLDDAVGECYDKVARVMNIGYPGGPIIDKLAHEGRTTYKLPLPLNDSSYNFSFSGLKSAVINLIHNEEQKGISINKEDLAASFQNAVIDVLTKKTIRILKEKNIKNLVLAGGVAANKGLRDRLELLCNDHNINYSAPNLKYCGDNATMIGAAAYYAYKAGRLATIDLNAKSSDKLA